MPNNELFEKLKDAGIPVISCTDDGEISTGQMDEEQRLVMAEIILLITGTNEQKQAVFSRVVQAHIDRAARARNYTDGLHAASYAVSTIPAWSAEGQAFVAWRDQVWLTAIGIMNACQAGTRAIPSAESLLAELPILEWPNE